MMSDYLLLLVVLECALLCSYQLEFPLPNVPLARPATLQVDAEGRAFVAAGNQLLRLSSDLLPEQSITLSSDAVNISLSSGGEWLVVCTTDLSCAVHNASNLSAVLVVTDSALVGADRGVALFTTGNSFYVGSFDTTNVVPAVLPVMRLSQTYGIDGSSISRRAIDYNDNEDNVMGNFLTVDTFRRDYFSGFVRGDYAYYVVSDHGLESSVRIMRVCHCSVGSMCPPIRVLSEEVIACGSTVASIRDGLCGVSVVEDFAGTSGTSILISRCRDDSPSSNVVCMISLSEVDRIMDMRVGVCSNNTNGDERTLIPWINRQNTPTDCSAITVCLSVS